MRGQRAQARSDLGGAQGAVRGCHWEGRVLGSPSRALRRRTLSPTARRGWDSWARIFLMKETREALEEEEWSIWEKPATGGGGEGAVTRCPVCVVAHGPISLASDPLCPSCPSNGPQTLTSGKGAYGLQAWASACWSLWPHLGAAGGEGAACLQGLPDELRPGRGLTSSPPPTL